MTMLINANSAVLINQCLIISQCLKGSDDLEKKWGQKGSTGQGFIFTEETSYKIHILVCMRAGAVIFVW